MKLNPGRLASSLGLGAVLLASLGSAWLAGAASFTTGNLVIYRVGDGSAALASTGTAVFLDESTTSGTLVQSVAVPTTTSGANRRLVASGSATTEGQVTRSVDGLYLVLAGYDAALGTTGLTSSSSATYNRVIARVDSSAAINTTTALTDASSGSNPRGVAATNGTDLWISGGAGGVRYTTLGSTTSTQLSTTVTNLRAVAIFASQLYISTQSGSTIRVGTVGSGIPTTSGQTITNLPGFSTTSAPNAFFLADLSAGVAGVDTLFVADETAGSILKYSLVAGTWTSNGTITAASVRGLTATVGGTTVTLYGTYSSASKLCKVIDTAGYNAAPSTTTVTDLATAGTNTAFRGLALAPASGLPSLTINDVSLNEGNAGTTTFTFTVSLSAPAGAGGVTFDIATADGTAQDDNPVSEDNDYVAKSLSSQTIPAGSSTYTFFVLVNGDTAPETNETFFVNVTIVTGATVTDGQGQGTITNDDAAPNLTINDVTLSEGNAGTTTFTFTVSLSAPAGAGGVTFDIATADNSAIAPGDYTAKSLTGQTIPAGSSTYTFDVLVNGDTSVESNETFYVNVTNITNAIGTDTQGLGTITNDDWAPIHDIQGSGDSSPLAGSSVTTRGIVTGVRPTGSSKGFFIQEPDLTVDADPATSEGVFVFTSVAPPAAAAVGNYVEVTGTVKEYVPSADTLQPPLTEITSPTTSLISSPNPLPDPIPLTAIFPDPAGTYDQLERLEGMRVSVASLTVVGPTLGSVSEANATATSSGVFYGVVTGVARPFREPGIQAPDPAPSGTIPPIPRFDSNPERIRVDSDDIGGPLIDVGTGAVVTGLVGPLDYSYRTYTILQDPAFSPGVSGGPTVMAVAFATGQELTVASANLRRFFDTVNDPAKSDAVLTAAALNNRLGKASLQIRDFLHMPDILGVVEMENLTTLQALAARISTDAIAASEADPQYAAYLVEGNDIGGIDVGFLVKTAPVAGSTPRVTVNAVVQELAGTLFVNPDTSTELLNDRPTLRLMAVVNHANGATFPVTVLVNHLRSLGSVNDDSPGSGSNGWSTAGARVRAKRQKQAEDLANLVQTRQTGDPTERIILVGDFNAYELNDGLGDSMDVIDGTPVPDNQTVVPGDGVDLVNPDLVNLHSTPPTAERYSYVYDGNAQSLDHVLVNASLISSTLARREEHARVNADFPEVVTGNYTTAARLSDHDPIVGFFQVAAFATADLSITKAEGADPVTAGTNLAYTITLANAGPDPASNASWSDTLPAGTTFQSLLGPGGWSCTVPAVGAGGTVSCSIASLAAPSAVFTLTVGVNPALAAGTVLSNTATATSTTADPDTDDLSSTETTTVATSADLSAAKVDTPDPVTPGSNLTYTITVTNAGPSNTASVTVTDPLPAGTTFQSGTPAAGWLCSTPSVGAGGTVSCSIASLPPGAAVFTVTVAVGATVPGGTTLSNTATVASATADPGPGNESDSEDTSVVSPAQLSGSKTVSGVLYPDGVATYTIVLTNTASSAQMDNPGDELTDVLPPELTLFSASATSGTAVANLATNTVTWNGSLAPSATVTITVQAAIKTSTLPGDPITNQAALAYDADGNGTNETAGVTDDPGVPGARNGTSFLTQRGESIPILDAYGLALLTLLIAALAVLVITRRGLIA